MFTTARHFPRCRCDRERTLPTEIKRGSPKVRLNVTHPIPSFNVSTHAAVNPTEYFWYLLLQIFALRAQRIPHKVGVPMRGENHPSRPRPSVRTNNCLSSSVLNCLSTFQLFHCSLGHEMAGGAGGGHSTLSGESVTAVPQHVGKTVWRIVT